MNVPAAPQRFELEIKRSRFIAEIEGCGDRSEAEATIARRRNEHPDAAHVVYAFSVGDTNNRQFGMSDDGEPKGTAGRPALEVLKGSGVTDCVLTIVRYFGGTKLGTGGLVHAYGDAAKGCFAALRTEPKRDLRYRTITASYEHLQQVKRVLQEYGVETVSQDFGEGVSLTVAVDAEREGDLQRRLSDVSRGTIELSEE